MSICVKGKNHFEYPVRASLKFPRGSNFDKKNFFQNLSVEICNFNAFVTALCSVCVIKIYTLDQVTIMSIKSNLRFYGIAP